MIRYIETTGKTKEEAVEKAAAELKVNPSELEIELLEEGTKGFFGFGAKDFKIKASIIDNYEKRINDFLNDIFRVLDIDAEILIKKSGDTAKVKIMGDSAGQLIGRRGESLDALQLLLGLAVNKAHTEYVKVLLDIEDYREKREQSLIRYANKMARTAAKQRKNIKLEPMNPYERRIVHSALQNDTYVTTYSEGEDPYRKVVISVKGTKN